MEDLITPGFRFYPTEEELVSFYLQNKIEGRRQDLDRVIPILYIYEFNPWDLSQYAGELCRQDPEQWFFFIPRQEKEARGGRPNRLTTAGYWKSTGSPGYVYSSDNRIIGMKRTMVFYEGRAPTGRKTEWKMNEYRAIEEEASSPNSANPKLRHEFSLCRVYIKSKCLRAFDRRPSASTTIATNEIAHQADHHHHRGDHDEATPSHQITTSPDQSSSGDHANPNSSQTVENINDWGDMTVDNIEPMWDWEQLNLF